MIDLDAIKTRLAAATAGPWLIIVEALRPRVDCERISGFGAATICTLDRRDPPDPNAVFICAARSDVPALVEEVERLRVGVEELAIVSEAAIGDAMKQTIDECAAFIAAYLPATASFEQRALAKKLADAVLELKDAVDDVAGVM